MSVEFQGPSRCDPKDSTKVMTASELSEPLP